MTSGTIPSSYYTAIKQYIAQIIQFLILKRDVAIVHQLSIFSANDNNWLLMA
jgi:hypothetical protein